MMVSRLAPVLLALTLALPAAAQKAPPSGRQKATASVTVKGKITFNLDIVNGNVTVKTGAKDKVTVTVDDCEPNALTLDLDGQTVEPEFDEFTECSGPVLAEVPPGSDLDLETVNGSLSLTGSFGNVDLEAVSGNVSLDTAANVHIESVSGQVQVKKATSGVEISTVSGSATVAQAAGAASKMQFETTSGSLDWSGGCGKDCRIRLETLSGELRLKFDGQPSFELKYESHNGNFKDALKMTIIKQAKNIMGGSFVKARIGNADGAVQAESFSGALIVSKK